MAHPKMPPVNLIRQLLMYHPWVPRRARFWLFVFFATVYQFTGGIYMASLNQMVSEMGLLAEDITMANYSSLIGLTMAFPMLFRLKFRFFTRQLFFLAAGGIIICTMLLLYIETPWLIWLLCFVIGFLKMMGMFGCMSSIQLCITPTRNFGVFFAVVYLLVCGAIQLTGICSAYLSYYSNWKMMQVFVIGFLVIHSGLVYYLMKPDHRSGPHLPLKGVDFFGFALWSLFLLVGTWVAVFGEHFEWFKSDAIHYATALWLIIIGLCIYRSTHAKDPYIALGAFKFQSVIALLLLLLGVATIESSAHLLQPALLSGVLRFDDLTVISMNIPEFIGVIFSALLIYYTIVRWKWSIKRILAFIVSLVLFYVISMYFLIDPRANIESFYVPIMMLGIAKGMLEGIATFWLSQTVTFQYFFQTIAIIGFARAGLGTAIASTAVHKLFHWSTVKNLNDVSGHVDGMTTASDLPIGLDESIIATVQSLMISIKECYGFLILLGIVILALVLLCHYKKYITRYVPRVMAVRRWLTSSTASDPTSA